MLVKHANACPLLENGYEEQMWSYWFELLVKGDILVGLEIETCIAALIHSCILVGSINSLLVVELFVLLRPSSNPPVETTRTCSWE